MDSLDNLLYRFAFLPLAGAEELSPEMAEGMVAKRTRSAHSQHSAGTTPRELRRAHDLRVVCLPS